MSRIVWLLGGLVVGISMGRNSQPFGAASGVAVVVLVVLAGALSWWAARRDLRSLVASSTATAIAAARVDFEARLEAHANAYGQVNVFGQVPATSAAGEPAVPHSVSVGPAAAAPIDVGPAQPATYIVQPSAVQA